MKKRKLWFKIVAIILAVLLLGSLALTIVTSLVSTVHASEELDDLQEQQEANREERAALEAQRNELESQKAANKKPSWFRKDKPGQRTKEHISDIANTRARNK